MSIPSMKSREEITCFLSLSGGSEKSTLLHWRWWNYESLEIFKIFHLKGPVAVVLLLSEPQQRWNLGFSLLWRDLSKMVVRLEQVAEISIFSYTLFGFFFQQSFIFDSSVELSREVREGHFWAHGTTEKKVSIKYWERNSRPQHIPNAQPC